MKNIKLVAFYSILLCSYQSLIFGAQKDIIPGGKGGMGVDAGLNAAKLLKFPQASTALGKNFGVGLYKMISDDAKAAFAIIGAAALAAKGSVVATVTAPVFIWTAGGLCVCGGGYYIYKKYQRVYYPTAYQLARTNLNKANTAKSKEMAERSNKETEKLAQEKELRTILARNITSPRDTFGNPIAAKDAICKYALIAGEEETTKILNTFRKYSPTIQSKL